MKNTLTIIGIFSSLLFHQCSSENEVDEGNCAPLRYATWSKEKVLFADCHHNKLTSVPNNLPDKIEALDLSYNNIWHITNDSFSKYSKLKSLILSNNNILTFENDALRPLSNLLSLDLNASTNIDISSIYLPPTLRTLILDRFLRIASTSKLPLSTLEELTFLSLNFCKLENFPTFDGIMPSLTVLELKDNGLTNFKTADISHFCQLKQILISEDSSFSKSCECRSLEKWAADHDFATRHFCSTSVSFEHCGEPKLDFSLDEYNLCIKVVETKTLWYRIKKGGQVLAVVIFIGLGVVGLYLFNCRRRKPTNVEA